MGRLICAISTLILLIKADDDLWTKQYRPGFHVSTPVGWGNDPNGMVFDGEQYHLFYQHYPYAAQWGPMHWAHATTTDLLNWTHHQIKVYPRGLRDLTSEITVPTDDEPYVVPDEERDQIGMAFSGSAWIDKTNFTGKGANTIFLMWTDHTDYRYGNGPSDVYRMEEQMMGYLLKSEDYEIMHYMAMEEGGIPNNLDYNVLFWGPTGQVESDFENDNRDPKIYEYQENGQTQLITVIADCDRITFHKTTPNKLNDWTPLSYFGPYNPNLNSQNNPNHVIHDPKCEHHSLDNIWGQMGHFWECPDFFKLSVSNEPSTELWVLIVSIGASEDDAPAGSDGPNKGSATQYFIGTFEEGRQFIPIEPESAYPKWIDYGPDNYAGVTYAGLGDNNVIFQAWMSNWIYANEVPTDGWRSGMTLARKLQLWNFGSTQSPDYRILQEFMPLDSIRHSLNTIHGSSGNNAYELYLQDVGAELKLTFNNINLNAQGEYTFTLSDRAKTGQVRVGLFIDAYGNQEFRIERDTLSGWTNEAWESTRVNRAPRVQTTKQSVKMHAVFDAASVEVLFDDGEVSMTALIFSETPLRKGSITASSGSFEGEIYGLEATTPHDMTWDPPTLAPVDTLPTSDQTLPPGATTAPVTVTGTVAGTTAPVTVPGGTTGETSTSTTTTATTRQSGVSATLSLGAAAFVIGMVGL